MYDYGPLITIFLIYFPLSCYLSGAAVATGIVIPSLILGSMIGRLVGLVMVDMFGVFWASNEPELFDWEWIDEGCMALLGVRACARASEQKRSLVCRVPGWSGGLSRAWRGEAVCCRQTVIASLFCCMLAPRSSPDCQAV